MSYEQLVSFKDWGGSDIVPLLAESYTISSDRLTYTFKVRQGIKFSNGDPMNAYCFWFCLYRIGVQNAPNTYAVSTGLGDNYWGRDGINAATLNEWTNPDNTPPSDQVDLVTNPKNHIYCPDPYTLVIQLENVFRPFLIMMTQPHASAISPNWVNQNGGTIDGNATSYLTLHVMGTGPFLLTDYSPNVQTVWTKNPTYWGGPGTGYHDPPKLDSIVSKVVPTDLSRVEDLLKGACQFTDVSPDLLPQAMQPGFYLAQLGLIASVQMIGLNCARPPFNNAMVRNAVVRAVDYAGIISTFNGLAAQWVPPIPRQIAGDDPSLQPYTQDLVTAKQLLAQAGYADGGGIPNLTYLYFTDQPMESSVASIVQANLADLGLTVNLQGLTQTAATDLMSGLTGGTDPRAPDLAFLTWTWFADPWGYANWFVTKYGIANGGNYAWYTNPAIEALIVTANAAATSDAARIQAYTQIQHLVYADAPYIPLTQLKNNTPAGAPVLSDKVQGLAKNAVGGNWTNFEPMYLTG
jgi:ABC-type transport system substrate-binding protein